LLANRACKSSNSGGKPCRAPPLHEGEFCLAHAPDHADEVAEARRLGGLRRRRERVASGIYDLDGLDTAAGVRRLLEIAVVDTLSLENSVARSRALAYLAMVAVKLWEVGEFEERLRSLEAAARPRLFSPPDS
jgi:hypothetical protein